MAIEEKALRMPKQIKPGDTLGVVAPSMPVKSEEKEKLTAYLQDAGYRVKLGKTVKELSSFHGYMAGDPRVRAEDVNQMFADPEVDGIICARGGYGSSQVSGSGYDPAASEAVSRLQRHYEFSFRLQPLLRVCHLPRSYADQQYDQEL